MMDLTFPPSMRRPAAIAAVLALAGCASVPADGGFDSVSAMTRERTGQPVNVARPNANGNADTGAVVSTLLAAPLTPDSAVRVALLNNADLQATFAGLGVAEADLVQAGRLRNPRMAFARLGGGGETEIDRSVMVDLAGLLTLPLRSGIEQRRYAQAKLRAVAQAVQLAAETRRAWYMAVAAQQAEQYGAQVLTAAEAGAELARRMERVGNLSRLDQAREQAFYAEAAAQLARARQQRIAAREQLTRLLGLWGSQTAYALPDRLPELPPSARDMRDAEQLAMTQRLDVQMARLDAQATASALGLTKATRVVNVFEAGYANQSQTGQPRRDGYEISLELPLFDWGGARVARAESAYMASVYRTADVAVRARSEVREAYAAYRSTYDLARHYRDEIVPLRKTISEEVLLRYNGMLAGVFELLADAREQVGSVQAAIMAQRDFWLAETALQAAINGGGMPAAMRGTAAAANDQGKE